MHLHDVKSVISSFLFPLVDVSKTLHVKEFCFRLNFLSPPLFGLAMKYAED